ncbi:MAG: acyl-CoA dehydrogenase family protein [Chloroflexota bacterium]
MQRDLYEETHLAFGQAYRQFLEKEVAPYHDQWETDGIVDKNLWRKAGAQGFLCMDVDTAYGGQGLKDYRYNMIMAETQAGMLLSGPLFNLGTDIVVPYISHYATEEQKQRWLPKLVTGEWISAIAMSEPHTGSDLASIETVAVDQGDHYLLNGRKFWISNGALSDILVVVAKTDPDARHSGISLLVLERDKQPYETVRILDKIGYKARDVTELCFDQIRVPKENLLGEEGHGFYYLMQQLPQERLGIAVSNIATAEALLNYTINWCQEREAFGRPIGKFQNTRFKLAEMKTEIAVGRAFVDKCARAHLTLDLTAEEAAMAKWWCSELLQRVTYQCSQLFGGRGYLEENPVARAFVDSRVETIYGGTTEIMKEIIGRSMGF